MAAQIVLVRHGPSAYVQSERMIDRGGVQKWRDDYDAAGIRLDGSKSGRVLATESGS